MYCGGCLRDNALVAALRKVGHDVTMVPLYLPLTLEDEDQSSDTPIFFTGINVYLQQKTHFFRHAPKWMHRWLASPRLLRWAAGRAGQTRPEDLGELTVSMLKGEQGNQTRELDALIDWLKPQERPDVICLSNALLLGLVWQLKAELNVPVICSLQGEDSFLDSLPAGSREIAWETARDRAGEVDLFIAPSRYFGQRMAKQLNISPEKMKVVYNGIDLDGFEISNLNNEKPPTLGFFARMCKEKGLDTLVDAFIELRRRNRVPHLKLKIGGSCGPGDEKFVAQQRKKIGAANLSRAVEFHPNLSRAAKIEFLKSLSLFSAPATYGEAFGLYVIEALAAGVPVVQPRHGAFPELVEATGGGVLCEANDVHALADAMEKLLLDPARTRALGADGHQAVVANFSAERMARQMGEVYAEVAARFSIANLKSKI